MADQLVATAREAGLAEFVIAATSLGAAVAVAARRPRPVRNPFTRCGYARPRTTLRLGLEMWASVLVRDEAELNAFVA
ncbi:hypothetical protein [Streptomyces sp. 351MFTsu5.1]|uniref:hypothetical protein n=1 Tax=Streptomyces sp. 351MFTsu5.1 TaxID=1172180 RepID=UPI000365FF24|nr:hypothetical protein [Streptomyces sp. 351MFTsu5.1]